MANTPIKDAMDTQGIRRQYTVDHDGPVLYAAGGETIQATVFGMKAIAQVIVSASDDSLYFAAPVFLKRGVDNSSFKLMWFVASSGAEAGAIDLSASTLRITAIGR